MKQVWKLFGIFIARLIGFLIKRFYNVLSPHESEYLSTRLKYSALLQSFYVYIHYLAVQNPHPSTPAKGSLG